MAGERRSPGKAPTDPRLLAHGALGAALCWRALATPKTDNDTFKLMFHLAREHREQTRVSPGAHKWLEAKMNVGTILLIILVLLLIGALPTWPYSAGWGPYPAGGLGLVLVIVLILVLVGRI